MTIATATPATEPIRAEMRVGGVPDAANFLCAWLAGVSLMYFVINYAISLGGPSLGTSLSNRRALSLAGLPARRGRSSRTTGVKAPGRRRSLGIRGAVFHLAPRHAETHQFADEKRLDAVHAFPACQVRPAPVSRPPISPVRLPSSRARFGGQEPSAAETRTSHPDVSPGILFIATTLARSIGARPSLIDVFPRAAATVRHESHAGLDRRGRRAARCFATPPISWLLLPPLRLRAASRRPMSGMPIPATNVA